MADSRGTAVQKVRLRKKNQQPSFISYAWANGTCNALRCLCGAALPGAPRHRDCSLGSSCIRLSCRHRWGHAASPGQAELPLGCSGSSTARGKWAWDPRDVWGHCCCISALGTSKTAPRWKAAFFHKGNHVFSLVAAKFYDRKGKKIKVITRGHQVLDFSDTLLQAGELYSSSKAFDLFDELHRFN